MFFGNFREYGNEYALKNRARRDAARSNIGQDDFSGKYTFSRAVYIESSFMSFEGKSKRVMRFSLCSLNCSARAFSQAKTRLCESRSFTWPQGHYSPYKMRESAFSSYFFRIRESYTHGKSRCCVNPAAPSGCKRSCGSNLFTYLLLL